MNLYIVQVDEPRKFNALKRKSIMSNIFDKMCEIYHTLSAKRKFHSHSNPLSLTLHSTFPSYPFPYLPYHFSLSP